VEKEQHFGETSHLHLQSTGVNQVCYIGEGEDRNHGCEQNSKEFIYIPKNFYTEGCRT